MNENQEHKIFTELGYIKKGISNLEFKMDKINGRVQDNDRRIQRHDVLVGKIGATVATVTFVFSVGITLALNTWLKIWR